MTARSERIPFGVGCFHFALRRHTPISITPTEYQRILTERLQGISALNHLHIRVGDIEEFVAPPGPLPSLGNSDSYFPPLSDCELRFDLYIPKRIQVELAEGFPQLAFDSEQFRVHMRYDYHGPVSYVELVGGGGSHNPSMAVKIVREYLSRAFSEAGGDIRFEFVGPSPFHADFVLERVDKFEDESDAIFFECESINFGGYADITFRYQADDHESASEALEALFTELSQELGLFYELLRLEGLSFLKWSAIEHQILEVTEVPPKAGWFARARRRVQVGRDLAQLQKRIVHFEAERLVERHQIRQHHRHTYDSDRPTFLKTFLDAALDDAPVFPTEQMRTLVGFMEERRSKAVELFVALIAALVGGVAGGLLTRALQG